MNLRYLLFKGTLIRRGVGSRGKRGKENREVYVTVLYYVSHYHWMKDILYIHDCIEDSKDDNSGYGTG